MDLSTFLVIAGLDPAIQTSAGTILPDRAVDAWGKPGHDEWDGAPQRAGWAPPMNLLRTDTNPWGQEVLLGISWDLLPVFVAAGALIILGHALFKALWEPAVRRRLERSRG